MEITLNNGENLAFQVLPGGASILVLIHGNMASSDQWDLLMDRLDPAYTVYAVDLRGYGKSSYHSPIHSIADFSEDLKLFTDALGLKSFHLMGWSNGGGVAMKFAADYPDRVEKLILLASMSTRGYPALDADGERLRTKDQIELDPGLNMLQSAVKHKNKNLFKSAMDQLLYSKNQPDEKRYDKYLENALNQRNLMDAAHAANQFNISNEPNEAAAGTGEIKNIKAPVLVLWGKNDLLTSEQMTLEIINDMKNSDIDVNYTVLPAGHAALIDHLEGVIDEVERFLRS
jgi:pimeloyl-ACP methyl ester carboxylesterase